jgi:hypothetical protein
VRARTERRRTRPGDVALLLLVLPYLLGCVLVLVQGAVAVAASVSPALHEALHAQELAGDVLGRLAKRTADASHNVPSWPQVALDYTLSLTHLGLAAFVLWLRPRERTGRLLVVEGGDASISLLPNGGSLEGAGGIGGFFEKVFAPRGLRPVHSKVLRNIAAHVEGG